MATYTIENFYDENEFLFYFSDSSKNELIANKKEIFDNVIPSGNALIAEALLTLGKILEVQLFEEIALSMIEKVRPLFTVNPEYMAKWASLALKASLPSFEIVVIGKEYINFSKEINNTTIQNFVICASSEQEKIPLFKDKLGKEGETLIYICYDKTCELPVNSVDLALQIINKFA